jgi:hypothetical protein
MTRLLTTLGIPEHLANAFLSNKKISSEEKTHIEEKGLIITPFNILLDFSFNLEQISDGCTSKGSLTSLSRAMRMKRIDWVGEFWSLKEDGEGEGEGEGENMREMRKVHSFPSKRIMQHCRNRPDADKYYLNKRDEEL